MSMLLRRVRVVGAGTYEVVPDEIPVVDIRVDDAGRIVAAASGLQTESSDEVVDLESRFVMPGLRDAHTHVADLAGAQRAVDLEPAISAEQVAELVAARHEDRPTGEVLWGIGFNDARFPDDMHKSMLDRAAPSRAVVLRSHDGHSIWASSAALALAGVDHPSGVLREAAMFAVAAAIPWADDTTLDAAVDEVLRRGAARGLTEIYDIEFVHGWANWTRRAEAGLPLRVWAAVTPDGLDAAIDGRWSTGMGNGLLRAGFLKLFADGALGSRTALCDHSYPGTEAYHGEQIWTVEEMAGFVTKAHGAGITTAIHAIGDAANRNALDAFDRAGVGGRIEHAQLLDRADVDRFRRLDVTASVQPSHLLDDRDIAEEYWTGRTDRAYAFADLQRAGARLEFGSDAPIAPFNPWRSIAAAVRRTEHDLPSWHPEQRVDLDTAISASTSKPRLEVGGPADLVVLDEHPATVPVGDLEAIPVRATMVAGRWTHGRVE